MRIATARWIATSAALLSLTQTGTHAGTPAAPVCGDGWIQAGEACDDGGRVSGDGCDSACAVEQQCYDAGNTFSFFTWSDSYGTSGDDGVVKVLTEATDLARHPGRVRPRFWIASGDVPFMADGRERLDGLNSVISNSKWGRKYPFRCPASRGTFPYFVALGNHDVDAYLSMPPPAKYDYWSNHVGPRLTGALLGARNFRWGPDLGHDARTTYSFDYKNTHFVVLNQYHGDPKYPTPEPKGCLREPLIEWLAADLAGTDRPLRFVFGHEAAWPYCSAEPGYGGEHCPPGSPDHQDPPYRPRPHGVLKTWPEPFGAHWGGSLDSPLCPAGSRDAFWKLLVRHRVVAHFVGHSHAYSSRLADAGGRSRKRAPAYGKEGAAYDVADGTFEIDSGRVHNSAGAVYVLTTVRDDVVTFEAYDSVRDEPFHRIDQWSVRADVVPR